MGGFLKRILRSAQKCGSLGFYVEKSISQSVNQINNLHLNSNGGKQ